MGGRVSFQLEGAGPTLFDILKTPTCPTGCQWRSSLPAKLTSSLADIQANDERSYTLVSSSVRYQSRSSILLAIKEELSITQPIFRYNIRMFQKCLSSSARSCFLLRMFTRTRNLIYQILRSLCRQNKMDHNSIK